jgi:hypothetical protein
MEMSFPRAGLAAFAGALLVLGLGCGGRNAPVKVQGVVRFEGQPLPRASVLFIPEGPGGRDARGFTNAEGVFQLSTFGTGDGALRGRYKVVIQCSDALPLPAAGKSPEEAQKAQAQAATPSRSLPAAYSQPDRTVLRQEVPAHGDVKFELYEDGRDPTLGGAR